VLGRKILRSRRQGGEVKWSFPVSVNGHPFKLACKGRESKIYSVALKGKPNF